MTLVRALVTRYGRAHALRATVTLVAVALGVASAYAIDLANDTAIASFSSSVNVIANRVNVQIVGGAEGFDERALLAVQRTPGVESASPVVSGNLVIGRQQAFSGEILHILGVDSTRSALPPGIHAARGAPSFDLHDFIDRNGVFVSERIAHVQGLKIGSVLRGYAGARAVRLRVDGIVPAGTIGVDSSVAFVDLATAQPLFRSIGKLDRIDVIAEPKRVASVVAALRRVVPPGARVLTPTTRVAEISRMLASFTMNLTALADVALLVGMYLIYNAVAISVVQRSAEIGTLRALGASRASIFRTFVAEGALYGIIGSLGGLVLGLVLARFSLASVEATISALYTNVHADAVRWSWRATVQACSLGTILSMLAAVVPALSAAATAPARVMRNTGAAERRLRGFTRATAAGGGALLLLALLATRAPALDGVPVFGYAAAILAIAAASLETPFALRLVTSVCSRLLHGAAWQLAAAFLRSSTRRIAVAVASLMVAVAMTIAIAVLVGSFRDTVVAWADETLSADLYVSAPGAADASTNGAFPLRTAAKLQRLRGVAAVNTFRGIDVPFKGRFAQLGATNFSSAVHRNALRFLGSVDLHRLSAEMHDANAAVVSVPFSTHFHLGVGDRFTLATPTGPVMLRILAIYNDYSTGGGSLFVDEATFRRLFHDASIDSIAIYLQPGASATAVRDEVIRALAPLRADVQSNDELRAYALAVFDRTFAITNALYVISVTIAVLGVVSTLFALVLERRSDIGLLRYVGATRGIVQKIVFLQALVVGMLAGALGVALGIALAADLIYVINRQSFGWLIDWHSPGWFYLEAFVMVVAAALIAAIYPASVASRIATSEVLRVE